MPDIPPIPALRRYDELRGRTFLLGVGGMKCATSWTFEYLSGFDEVTVAPLKELHFFNTRVRVPGLTSFAPQLAGLARDFLQQAPDIAAELIANAQFQAAVDGLQMLHDDNAYFGHFARIAAPETRVLAECTPQYALLGSEGFDYIRRFFASQEMSLKVLFLMRDPVARLWSHLRSLPREDGDLLEALPKLIRRRDVLMRSDFWQTVEALDAVFPAGDVLYLFYEDIFDGDGLADLCRFAGLPGRDASTATRENATPDRTALPDSVAERLEKVLAPQYRFCRERFGSAIPAVWRR